MSNHVVICCAGIARRWGCDLPVPHKALLSPFGDETLVARTTRLAHVCAPDSKVFIVGNVPELATPGATLVAPPEAHPRPCDVDAFWNTIPYWSEHPSEHTIILNGDVWYSYEAAQTIFGYTPLRECHWFGRQRGSAVSGKTWPELFAISFDPYGGQLLTKCIDRVRADFHAGRLQRAIGWDINANMTSHHPQVNPFTTIDDWTDDFDSQEEFDRWCKRARQARSNDAFQLSEPRPGL
jgi:hypothetical protein